MARINKDQLDTTLVDTTATQTLSGKSLSGSANTFTAIPNTSLVNSSVTVGSTSIALGATAATIAGLTLTTPTISSTGFTNAQHNHTGATSGGQLTDAALSTAVTVAKGGTGRATSTTAYGIIAAGTTATGAHQTLATGTAGQILKSAGAASLPVFATGAPADVALGNVTNDAQLKQASNLSDLANTTTARTNLGVYSTTQTDTAVNTRVLKNELVYDVKDYGATGNGSTDDTAAVQAALTAAGTTGGVVFFPPGTYFCDPVYAPIKVSVKGAGPYASIIKRRPATTTNPDSIGNLNFHGSSTTKFYAFFVRDIGIDGNKANITIGSGGDPYDVEGLSLKWSEQFTIDNVRTVDAYADGFDFDDCADGTIQNCVALNCGGSGIHFSEGSSRLTAIGNVASGNGNTLSRSGIDQYTLTTDCVFLGNYAYNNFRGYNIDGSGAVFAGNYSTGNTNTSLTPGVGRSWTPTFTNLSGGTLNYARFSMGDGWVDYELKYTMSGANVTGEVTFTVPVPISATYGVPAPIGRAIFGDTGVASYPGIAMVDGTTTIRVRPFNAAATYATTATLSATIPFTWGSTDILFVNGRYKIA